METTNGFPTFLVHPITSHQYGFSDVDIVVVFKEKLDHILTPMRAFASVNSLMFGKMCSLTKVLSTVPAFKRFVSGVDFLMTAEI